MPTLSEKSSPNWRGWQRSDQLAFLLALRQRRRGAHDDYLSWLKTYLPAPRWNWDWPHLQLFRKELKRVEGGEVRRLAIAVPPQHGKTWGITIPFSAYRMLSKPGIRAGVGSHTQKYANKISRNVRKLVLSAGGCIGGVDREDEWELNNGSSFVAKGVGAAVAGEPFDQFVMDDVFGTREDADSLTTQEKVHEWYMDDVTPRLQSGAPLILCNTRWGAGDLFGRIKDSDEWPSWTCIRIPAVSEDQDERDRINSTYGLPHGLPDPIGRDPGLPLCGDRFTLADLEAKRQASGVGFESLYQGNPIPRGGTFFERVWFSEPVPSLPEGAKLVRYYDLASSRKDSACYTSGLLLAKVGKDEATRFYVVDVVRGRWMPAERNEIMLQTAIADESRPGFERTYFEQPVFDKDGDARRGIMAKLAGHRIASHNVSGSGSKELRAEPVAGAAKSGLIRLVAGAWVSAFLTELESFPRGQWKDQVDSLSGAYSMLTRPSGSFAVGSGGAVISSGGL